MRNVMKEMTFEEANKAWRISSEYAKESGDYTRSGYTEAYRQFDLRVADSPKCERCIHCKECSMKKSVEAANQIVTNCYYFKER